MIVNVGTYYIGEHFLQLVDGSVFRNALRNFLLRQIILLNKNSFFYHSVHIASFYNKVFILPLNARL